MAETRAGGVYRVGSQWVDAEGRPVKAPEKPAKKTKAETSDETPVEEEKA